MKTQLTPHNHNPQLQIRNAVGVHCSAVHLHCDIISFFSPFLFFAWLGGVLNSKRTDFLSG